MSGWPGGFLLPTHSAVGMRRWWKALSSRNPRVCQLRDAPAESWCRPSVRGREAPDAKWPCLSSSRRPLIWKAARWGREDGCVLFLAPLSRVSLSKEEEQRGCFCKDSRVPHLSSFSGPFAVGPCSLLPESSRLLELPSFLVCAGLLAGCPSVGGTSCVGTCGPVVLG